jgi:hypothetical protein
MALNLIRNSRVFLTNNLTSSGAVAASGFDDTNTFEIQVQDGFSFSQNTGTETVTLNEAGAAPIRGQRSFNTSLEPVDWNFATYVRPKFDAGGAGTGDDQVVAEEAVLWNAMSGTDAIGDPNAGWTATAGTTPVSKVAFGNSNAHQLKAFGLIIVFEAVAYAIDNCAVDSATIDFGLDAIASITWAGKGTAMRQLSSVTIGTPSAGVVTLGGGLSGTAKYKDTQARYIANKLSTMSIAALAFGGLSAKTYSLAITGGSITINNNLTYLTPANLGVVNQPITYFTGSRAISATVTAYLKTGTNETAQLLSDLLTASSTSTENKFAVTVDLGGSSNANRISLSMPTTMLTIPTITSEQVISTSITLNPQGATSGAYDIEAKNELEVSYYAAA